MGEKFHTWQEKRGPFYFAGPYDVNLKVLAAVLLCISPLTAHIHSRLEHIRVPGTFGRTRTWNVNRPYKAFYGTSAIQVAMSAMDKLDLTGV